jgi:hypothetical protein
MADQDEQLRQLKRIADYAAVSCYFLLVILLCQVLSCVHQVITTHAPD